MTTKIEVPKENYEALKFPDKCHVCSKPSPDSIACVKARGGTNKPLNEDIGKIWQLDVPACNGCKSWLWWSRILSSILFFISVLVVLAVLLLANMLFENLSTWANLILVFGTILVANIISAKIFTAPFEVDPFDDRLVFYYKDDKMGEEFAILNGVEEITDHLNLPKDFQYFDKSNISKTEATHQISEN